MNALNLRISSGSIKKGAKSNKQISPFKFSDTFLHKFGDVQNIIKFVETNYIDEQLDFLRNISKRFDSLTEDDENIQRITSLLIDVFLLVPVKHPLKNTASRILSSKKLHLSNIEDKLSTELLEYLSAPNDDKSLSEVNKLYTVINSCFDNFTPGIGAVKKCAIVLLQSISDDLRKYVTVIRSDSSKLSPTEKLDLYTYIHNLDRVLLTILQKCDVNSHSIDCGQLWYELYECLLFLIKHGDLPMDTKIICSMIFVTVLQLNFGNEIWKHILEIIFGVENYYDHVLYENLKDLNNPIEVLCISSALLNVFSVDDVQYLRITDVPVLIFISNALYNLSEVMSVETTVIIGIARAMFSISRLLFKVPADVQMITDVTKIVLSFIWSHLEYYVDSVRHLSTQILVNIVKISVQLKNSDNGSLSTLVISSVVSLPADRHSKYKGLATLVCEYGAEHFSNEYPDITKLLLQALNNQTIPANLSVTYETLMSEFNKVIPTEVLFRMWIKPVLETLLRFEQFDKKSPTSWIVLQDILSKGIKLNPDMVSFMIPYILRRVSNGNLTDRELKCILVCLHIARKAGSFDQDTSESVDKWKNIIDFDILRSATCHQISEIRILCLHLVIDTCKSTEMFTEIELEVIQMFFNYNVNIQSPSIRQDILALTKKMLKRWNDSFDVLLRNITNALNKSTNDPGNLHIDSEKMNNLKDLYINFVENLWSFAMNNTFFEANFSRRNISLQILVWCQEFIKTKHVTFIWNKKGAAALIDCLGDSYECNKQLAVDLLTSCPVEYLKFQDLDFLKAFLEETLSKASSVKPSDCTTSAYRLSLLLRFPKHCKNVLCELPLHLGRIHCEVHYQIIQLLMMRLNSEIEVADGSILMAAAKGPMYGLVHCIRHVLNQADFLIISRSAPWSSMLYDLVQMSFKVNRIVASVVNSSSPEGHLPMDFNAGSSFDESFGFLLEDLTTVTAQMVLLCAWRSVKEVSLLLGDISYNVELNNEPIEKSVSSELILEIGDHFTTLLSETKHRGAFEQAYLGFSKLCLSLWKSKTESLHTLPYVWLDHLISAISGDTTNSKLCATRRSAGVPFMVQALVTTELQVSGKPQSFQKCMTTLLRLAAFDNRNSNTTSVETRTHCLNILRALYRHTALGEYVNTYVAEGVMAAIMGFDGSTWAERNSSTLLFSSLMTRIFGVQRSKDSDSLCIRNRMTGRIFFLRYPQLYDFLLKHLSEVVEDIGSVDLSKPSLYPVLLLLARLYPSSLEGTDSNLKLVAFIPYLLACSKSCVLKTRQLAAKALVPLISYDRYFPQILSLLEILTDKEMKTNYCHGILLQLIRLLQNPPETDIISHKKILNKMAFYMDKSKWILINLHSGKPCFITAESYLQVVYLCLVKFRLFTLKGEYSESIFKQLDLINKDYLKMHPGKEQFFITLLHLLMHLAQEKEDFLKISSMLNTYKNLPVYELQSVALNYILCIQNKSDLKLIEDQFEIGNIERSFLSKFFSSFNKKQLCNFICSSCSDDESLKSYEEYEIKYSQRCHKQLMILADSKYSSSRFWKSIFTNANLIGDNIVNLYMKFYNKQQPIHELVFMKHININIDSKNCSSIYDSFSDVSSVMLLSNCMYESWSSCDNCLYINMECVQFFKNHWKILNWDKDILEKERVISVILQWSSLLQLLDNEEEIVRHGACEVVTNIFKHYTKKMTYPVCENRAREMFLELVSEWCSKVSQDFSIFVFTVLALINVDGDCCTPASEDLVGAEIFDKEVGTYGEMMITIRIYATIVSKILGEEQLLKDEKNKSLFLLNILEIQCEYFTTFIGDNGKFSIFYFFIEVLRKGYDIVDDANSLAARRITLFLNCLSINKTPEIAS